jgi:hypothetical protein
MFGLMDRLLKSEGLDLKARMRLVAHTRIINNSVITTVQFTPYRVLAVGPDEGLIEWIEASAPISRILAENYSSNPIQVCGHLCACASASE